MKIDPYNHEKRYKTWKAQVLISGILNISKENSDLILRYLHDMEHGINISSTNKKGCRSYIRLNTLREKMIFFSKKFKEIYDIDNITKISEDQLMLFFSQMRKGEIRRKDGKQYLSKNGETSFKTLEIKLRTGFRSIKIQCEELKFFGAVEFIHQDKNPNTGRPSTSVKITERGKELI